MKVSYLGPEGTFSEIAVLHYFSGNISKIPKSSIDDVFKSVEKLEVDHGLIPIENSIEGSINNTLDLLSVSKVLVTGEMELIINQCLFSKETDLNSIERIYGHQQSLAQCKKWIFKNIPQAELISVASNSLGALSLKKPGDACIGAEIIAEYYSLEIISKKIQDDKSNTTRFLIIGNSTSAATGFDKTSILIRPPNTGDSGSLYRILEPFSNNRINLSRIESRPSKTRNWKYIFFIDIDGHIEDVNVQKTIETLKAMTVEIKFLGSYPKFQYK